MALAPASLESRKEVARTAAPNQRRPRPMSPPSVAKGAATRLKNRFPDKRADEVLKFLIDKHDIHVNRQAMNDKLLVIQCRIHGRHVIVLNTNMPAEVQSFALADAVYRCIAGLPAIAPDALSNSINQYAASLFARCLTGYTGPEGVSYNIGDFLEQ